MDWSSKKVTTVVDIVPRPKCELAYSIIHHPPLLSLSLSLSLSAAGEFPGFYNLSFPLRCWDSSGTRLLLHNSWGSLVQVTHVDITTGTVSNVSGSNSKGAWLVLDVSYDLVVAQFASLNQCPQLVKGSLLV